ncbi:phosphoenolpyruvate--protein phosphotransferase [Desulfonema magnum]|uniref:phosphoenolpyruvate--protein phosphotransferase n=1 Tax=Desulfonema magnum TaxID=45655 RepID=A0A975BT35_9BACT|nr:phosphoenolpyruvate--protein phosphotransferase [Desulfonema magnum]QTA91279.1 Putative phosphoenolpyruvate-protein phosphotransferase, PtsI-like [Desulfonema magnum]
MMRKVRDRFNLLCDIGDLSALLTESSNIESFLQSTVTMVSQYLNADVCSIYLYKEKSKELVLKATLGLNPEAVGKIRMKRGKGLVGNTFEQLRPIREACASLNPNFKYFKEAEEDRFESFLSVPILRGSRKIGVLVVQHEDQDFFSEIDTVILRALASQLAGTIENARLMIDLRHRDAKPLSSSSDADIFESLRFIKGRSASGGYAFAPSTIFNRSHGKLLSDESESDGVYSLEDFNRAVRKTSEQLIEFQSRLAEQLLESASLIFDAHFMILKDAQFINKIVQHIIDGISPPRAVKEVARHYIDIFSSSSNEYIREKVNDVEDLAGRILKNLYNWSAENPNIWESRIVIAKELYPSEVLKLASEDVKGIILVSGGVTSHVSILCRSLKIPLVIADLSQLLNLPEGTLVLMDGEIGNIYVCPTEQIIQQFEKQKTTLKATRSAKSVMSPLTRTSDGVRVHLLANINLLSELGIARELKAEGVGLYRTEFPFLIRSSFPSEEEQYLVYKRLFDEMAGQEVTIRTLDIGGDKMLAYSNPTAGSNPELGLRSIRFSLSHRNIFEQQLRAILRASAEAENVRILFPMISSLDEFREAKQAVLDSITSLKQEYAPHHPGPATGIMIEVPSVMGIIREFTTEADFFSIGTNDFVQYMIGVDRGNEKVADYYRPYHPSVLRGLAQIVRAVTEKDKDISICGEMAHELEYIPFLLGIGVRRISVDPQFLPVLQDRISHLNLSDAEKHAKEMLSKATLKDTREVLQRQIASN